MASKMEGKWKHVLIAKLVERWLFTRKVVGQKLWIFVTNPVEVALRDWSCCTSICTLKRSAIVVLNIMGKGIKLIPSLVNQKHVRQDQSLTYHFIIKDGHFEPAAASSASRLDWL